VGNAYGACTGGVTAATRRFLLASMLLASCCDDGASGDTSPRGEAIQVLACAGR